MSLQITTMFVGLLAILQVLLTANVISRRLTAGVSLLDGGDEILKRRMRAHGNFTETVPITLLAMAASELAGLADWTLMLGGLSLLGGRLIHAFALITAAPLNYRVIGMAMTFLPLAGFGGWSLISSIASF